MNRHWSRVSAIHLPSRPATAPLGIATSMQREGASSAWSVAAQANASALRRAVRNMGILRIRKSRLEGGLDGQSKTVGSFRLRRLTTILRARSQ
jgi:hypothetical protein